MLEVGEFFSMCVSIDFRKFACEAFGKEQGQNKIEKRMKRRRNQDKKIKGKDEKNKRINRRRERSKERESPTACR